MRRIDTGRAHGFTLVEVLVALVVLTVGMLGVAVLYVEGLRLNRTSIYRTLAVGLASDMADRIRVNSTVPGSYAGNGPGANNGCVNGVAVCSPQEVAADDWFWWWRDVQDALPLGVRAEVAITPIVGTAMNRYDITLTWPEPGHVDDGGNLVPVQYTLPVQL